MLMLAAGCSSTPATEFARVTGHVSCRGKPILIGKITVFTDGGVFDTASIDDGQYVLSRAPIGTVHVVLVGSTVRRDAKQMEAGKMSHIRASSERMKKWEAQGKNLDDLPPEPIPEDPEGIPSKYSGDRTTPLTREVKSGSQVIDIDIED
ncbi:MAG TPA: hypothetical protein VGP68_06820 [Gemmataceae bacterium]|nr:hypothetical protein [Gemmataceae bacterium]